MSVNFDNYDDETVEQALQFVQNSASVRTRPEVAAKFGKQYGGDRNTYEVLGYPDEVTAERYRARYRRQDIAKRIVDMPAEDTWGSPPDIVDGEIEDSDTESATQFEDDIDRLDREHRLFHYCKRADAVAGIGEYGLLFIGVADGQDLSEEVNDGVLNSIDDLAYLSPFGQDSVEDWVLGREAGLEPNHPRYNKPVVYEVDFSDVDDSSSGDEEVREVHWTRIIHIAEDPVESDLKGTPRLRPVYNRLLDLEKVVGASAEMFWTGADRKFQFNIDTDDTTRVDPSALDELDEEVKSLVHDMEPYIKTFNTDMEVLGGEEVDPTGVIDEILKFIAGATGIPMRILTGSERGELASSQDRATWFGRIERRQSNFAEPVILRPLVDRLISFGIIVEPSAGNYEVEWPNLFELTDLEQAEVQSKRAQAIDRASPKGNTDMVATPEQIVDWVIDGDKPDFEEMDAPPAEGGDADDFEVDDEQAEEQFNAFRATRY